MDTQVTFSARASLVAGFADPSVSRYFCLASEITLVVQPLR